MNITAGAVIILVIVICGVLFFRTKTGKHVKLRAAGTAEEVIQKDASTPEGAKAYYNVAIEKKEEDLQKANVIYQQMLGKISGYEDQLFHLRKDAMKADVNVNSCVDRGDDEGARVYLKEQQEINDKIDIIKNALKELKNNADIQKESVDSLQEQLKDLKEEKDNKEKAAIEAEQAKITAEGKAEATRIKADAEAEANKKIAESLTPELIEKQKIDKWNGDVPKVQGGNAATIIDAGDLTSNDGTTTVKGE